MVDIIGSERVEFDTPSHRDVLFISHANPEDNTYAVWLASKLILAGYEVWLDLNDFLGGERCWEVIADILETKAAKVLLITSNTSIKKQGVIREIDLAKQIETRNGLANYLVPIKIDPELSFSDFPKVLTDETYIGIDSSIDWPQALTKLLKRLVKDNVPKCTNPNAITVDKLQKLLSPRSKALIDKPEKLQTNWYQISQQPKRLYVYCVEGTEDTAIRERLGGFPYPFSVFNGYLVSFSEMEELSNFFSQEEIGLVETVCLDEFLEKGFSDRKISSQVAQNIVTSLFRQAWDKFLEKNNLMPYDFSQTGRGWWLKRNLKEGNKVKYVRPSTGESTWCVLVGKVYDDFWHFCLEAKPYLSHPARFVMIPHVVCSSNGQSILPPKRLRQVKKKVTATWFNNEWRDKTQAFMSHLAGGNSEFNLPVSSGQEIVVSTIPIMPESEKSLSDDYIEHVEASDFLDDYQEMSSTELYEEAAS